MTNIEKLLSDHKISLYKFIKAMDFAPGTMTHWYEKLRGKRSVTSEEVILISKTYTFLIKQPLPDDNFKIEKMRLI